MTTSDFRPTKHLSNKQLAVDWISELPDEIIVHTLSLLTLEEAARTSVLSKRWEHLWKFVPKVDFGDVNLWVGWLGNDRVMIPPGCEGKYVKLVNKVLGSHKAKKLDVFRIQFDLGSRFKDDLDSWLQYALSRKVDRLDLNLSVYGIDACLWPTYTLSPDVLGLSAGNANVSSIATFLGFKTLRALTLNAVNVSESIIGFFLCDCPLLEDLKVANNDHLKQLQVCGLSLALKHLEIVNCKQLVSLTICDSNIVSLRVTKGEALALNNVPNLVDVSIGHSEGALELVSHSVYRLSCSLSKIVALTLCIEVSQEIMAYAQPGGVKELARDLLPQLRQLTFFLAIPLDVSLFPFTPLIRASPMLEKFVVKFDQQFAVIMENQVVTDGRKEGYLRFPLRNLKVVEFCGYLGHRNREVELVKYFVENSVALEKIIVDVHGDQSLFRWPVTRRADRVAFTRARQQLLPLLPSSVQLVLL